MNPFEKHIYMINKLVIMCHPIEFKRILIDKKNIINPKIKKAIAVAMAFLELWAILESNQ